jgi:hypothetical protein
MKEILATVAALFAYCGAQAWAILYHPALCTLLLCDMHGGGHGDTIRQDANVAVIVGLVIIIVGLMHV